jgi:hypothetical protein
MSSLSGKTAAVTVASKGIVASPEAPIVGLTASLTPRKCLGFTRQIAFVTAATATLSPGILRSAPGPVTIWS